MSEQNDQGFRRFLSSATRGAGAEWKYHYLVKYNMKFQQGEKIMEWGTDSTNVFVKDFTEIPKELYDNFICGKTTTKLLTIFNVELVRERGIPRAKA